MTSREDFKQAIRAGKINEAFLVAMSNAPELSITTKIITADSKPSQGDNSLRTHISLIEGKIENEIGEQLTGDRYGEIKQFHLEQVTEGHHTIQQNLISLQRMFQLMSAFQAQQTTEPANWVDIAADVAREPLPSRQSESELYGKKAPEVLMAGKEHAPTSMVLPLKTDLDQNPEPQLPSFVPEEDDDDQIVDDLLSLTDLDDDDDDDDVAEEVVAAEKETAATDDQGDWGDWLEEEPEVKPQVFDLKTLNLREASQKWQKWDAHHADNSQPAGD